MDAKFAVVLVLLLSTAAAVETIGSDIEVTPIKLSVSKSVDKSTLAFGETVATTILIKNLRENPVDVHVKEYIGAFDVVSEQEIYSPRWPHEDYPPEILLSSIVWDKTVPAFGEVKLEYKLKPRSVGLVVLPPTGVEVPFHLFESDSLDIHVGCSTEPGCNPKIGETILTCPEKCGAPIPTQTATPTGQPPAVEPEQDVLSAVVSFVASFLSELLQG